MMSRWLRTFAVWSLVCGACSGDTAPPADAGTITSDAASHILREAHAREVSVESDGLTLRGTLHLPARYDYEVVPAIVLGHGSGPSSRHETLGGQLAFQFGFELHVFDELAAALVARGYAVLVYDKRTCGPFNGLCPDNDYPLAQARDSTHEDYIHDAVRMLDHLESQEEVDASRVFYLGHSEAGQYLPHVLERAPFVRAGVILAGPYHPIDQILVEQAAYVRDVLRGLGWMESRIDMTLADLDEQNVALAELRAGTFTGATIGGVSIAHWQNWIEVGETAPAAFVALDRPVLAVSGSFDTNVPPSETHAWQAIIDTLDTNPGHRTLVLPCITHAMNCVDAPALLEARASDIGRHVDDSVVTAIDNFLSAESP